MDAHNALQQLMVAPFRIQDPGDGGTIYVDRWGGVAEITTEGASETRILHTPPQEGIQVKVVHDTDGGDFTLTVNPASGTCYGYNQANATTIAFADAGDWAMFVSVAIGTEIVWRLVAQEGTNATFTGGGTVTSETITTATITTGTITDLTATKLKLAVTAVTAVGAVQSDATNSLSPGLNVIKGGGASLGVKLPTAEAGMVVLVENASGSTALIYGAVTAAIINALATTTGYSLATTKNTILVAENSSQWWTFPLAVA